MHACTFGVCPPATAGWQRELGQHPAPSPSRLGVHAEIGATAVHPADVTMRRGIMMGYVTIICAYLTVSITGAARAATHHPKPRQWTCARHPCRAHMSAAGVPEAVTVSSTLSCCCGTEVGVWIGQP